MDDAALILLLLFCLVGVCGRGEGVVCVSGFLLLFVIFLFWFFWFGPFLGVVVV